MGFDWKDVAKVVRKGAPILGGLLGGPLGSAAANAGVSVLCSALGVEEDPDEVMQAIEQNPEALARIREAEIQHQTGLRELQIEQAISQQAEETKRIQVVNATMQAEGKSEHWAQWFWRPFCGFCAGGSLTLLVVFCAILAWRAISAGNEGAMRMIPDLIGAFLPIFGVFGAILGVASWHRGKKQRVEAGDQAKGGLVGVIEAIKQ
jgi:hypothetical protein